MVAVMPSPQPFQPDALLASLARRQAFSLDEGARLPAHEDPYQRFSSVRPELVAQALAEVCQTQVLPPDARPSRSLVNEITALSADRVREIRTVPYRREGQAIVFLTDRPDLFAQRTQDLSFFLGDAPLRCVVAPPAVVSTLLQECYPLSLPTTSSALKGRNSAPQEAPIVQLIDRLLRSAVDRRASDILIQPEEHVLRVRFRIDGILRDVQSMERISAEQIAARLKTMAELKLDESRRPQDGRFQQVVGGKAIDFRISFFRVAHGETIAIRILDSSQGLLSLSEVGLLPGDRERLERIIQAPNGLVLVSGPTGSGKTTTLYAALNARNTRDVSIYTIEDPVEYRIPGVMQSSVHEAIGVTFQSGLRTLLRHNPNIILVGEIRDAETASIAAQAALTGHLVFSTIHTNDSVGAMTRMVDLGTERFVVGSSLRAVVAQRLARRLCDSCSETRPLAPMDAQLLGIRPEAAENASARHPVGCTACDHSGYRGRLPLFEILEVTEPLRDLLCSGAQESAIRAAALQAHALTSLLDDGIQKVLSGYTSAAEIVRVLGRPRLNPPALEQGVQQSV